MKLRKRSVVFIVLLIVCAFVMTLEFGGNWCTFYEWLLGEGFSHSAMPDDSLFTVLSWIYLLTLIATVILEIIGKYDFMKLSLYINFGAMLIIFAFGLYGTTVRYLQDHGPFCIGMPLLFLLSLTFLVLGIFWKQEQ